MSMTEIVKVFGERKIRSVWDDVAEEWYFSVVDVVAVLTESADPATYWRVLKNRLKHEGNETVTNCNRLKLRAEDGKMRLMDVATPEQMFWLIQSIPSPKAEPFKIWMAKVAAVSPRTRVWRSRRRRDRRLSHRSTRQMQVRLTWTMALPPCREMRYNMGMREKMKNTDLYKYLAFFKQFKILDSLCLKSGLRLGWSMLRGNEQLFASKYRLCLPSEAELKAEIEAQKARLVEQHLK